MTRADRREDTRRRLLAAARARFAAAGFEGATLRDVAADAGVALGTVFVHFADKRDLLLAALLDDLQSVPRDDAPQAFEPWLAERTAAWLAPYLAQPAFAREALRHALVADPPWRERFAGQIAAAAAEVVARVQAEQAAGRLAGDADPRVFAAAWVAFVQFALVAWAQGQAEPARLVAAMVHQQLQGMRP